MPFMAESKNSRLLEMTLYRNGEAIWMTISNGGVDFTTSSKAPGVAMSGTAPNLSLEP